jgi:hypothetical protein
MTADQWSNCTDLYPMLEFLRHKASDRKFRLFAAACHRRLWHRFEDTRTRRAIELAERMADEPVDETEWDEVHEAAHAAWEEAWAASLAAQRKAPRGTAEVERLVWADHFTAEGWVALEDGWEAAYSATAVEWDEELADEPRHQLALLHDIMGGPFRRVVVDRSWRSWNDEAVVKLARAIYEERAFDRLPLLASLLETAGCTDPDLLAHFRTPGEHARGCWAVDLLLCKQ